MTIGTRNFVYSGSYARYPVKNAKKTAGKAENAESTEFIAPEERNNLEMKKKREEASREVLEKQNEIKMLKDELENSKEQAKGAEKSFETLAKCLTIASRIARGDIVPPKDMKYLAENEPDLYKQAILLRQPKKDPKEYDSVLEDEDEESGDTPSDSALDNGGGVSEFSVPETEGAEAPASIEASE